jgi:hypothetical protein
LAVVVTSAALDKGVAAPLVVDQWRTDSSEALV